jgi:hypothetical protein
MIDKEWIRNLAQSEHNGQGWIFHEREQVDSLCEKRRTHILADLRSEAETMVQTYNLFDQKGVAIKVLQSKNGINFMYGACQLGISLIGHELHSQLIMQQAFQVKKFNLHTYTPYFDTFGQLLWSEGQNRNLTYSLILQNALVEIAEAYCRVRQG